MQSRVLMPSGRGRRSAAAIAAASAISSTSSPVPPPPPPTDFYSTIASLSAMTGGSSAAASLMGYAGMPYTLGLGALGLTNPMYAASLASLGMLPGMAALSGLDGSGAEVDKDTGDGKTEKSRQSKDKEADVSDDMAASSSASIHPSFPYMYNPLLFNPLYAQSLAAAASNFGLPGPFGALGLGVDGAIDSSTTVDEVHKVEPKPHKSRKVTESPVLSKSRAHTPSESYRSSKSYTEPSRAGLSDGQSRVSGSFADSAAAGADQAEPEDLSVLSSKRKKTTNDGQLASGRVSVRDEHVAARLPSAGAVETCDHVEDLRNKPASAASPVVSAVSESRNSVSKSSRSPSPEKSTAASDNSTLSVRESAVPSSKPDRSRSRLIDSIGNKLMAKRQKVQTDVLDVSKSADESADTAAACSAVQPAEPVSFSAVSPPPASVSSENVSTADAPLPEPDACATAPDVSSLPTENCETESAS